VENNFALRPVYFSNFAEATFYGGLNSHFQNCGLTSRLTPVETGNTDKNSYDVNKLELLLQSENFNYLPTLKTDDIPRISGAVFMYHITFRLLAQEYKQNGQMEKLKALIELYKSSIAIGLDEEYEAEILEEMEGMLGN
jgi:hypothetical protein